MIEPNENPDFKGNVTTETDEMSPKEAAKKKKVDRRRSIEEYIERKRWKEENSDLADLYEAECY